MPPESKLVVSRTVRPLARKRVALIAAGAASAVARLLKTPTAKLAPFNKWRGGSGLSVVVAHSVVEAHGGQILAERVRRPAEPAALVVLPLRAPRR
jgi:hypothetical protein